VGTRNPGTVTFEDKSPQMPKIIYFWEHNFSAANSKFKKFSFAGKRAFNIYE